MGIITLTTDFGNSHYVASLKGKILSLKEDATIVDISHNISPFSKTETAFTLKNCYKDFPKGSVHIIGVCSEFTENNNPIISEINGHYFICGNNGILSMILENNFIENTYSINTEKTHYNFTARDIFIETAVKILNNEKLNSFAIKTENLIEISLFKPYLSNKKINGNIIYIDNYGNCVSNIDIEFFNKNKLSDKFTLNLKRQYHTIKNFSENYTDIRVKQEPYFLFNSNGLLEIAMFETNPHKHGSASTLLGIDIQNEIEVNFL